MGCCGSRAGKLYELNKSLLVEKENVHGFGWQYVAEKYDTNYSSSSTDFPNFINNYIRGKGKLVGKLKSLKTETGSIATHINMRYLNSVLISNTKDFVLHEECITIDQFYEFLLQQWVKEHQFNEVYLELKKSVSEELKKINPQNNENLTKIINEQEKYFFSHIEHKLNYAVRNTAGNFCKELMGESVISISNKIDDVVNYLINPPSCVLPEGILEYLKKELSKNISQDQVAKEVTHVVSNLIKMIDENMKEIEIETLDQKEVDCIREGFSKIDPGKKKMILKINNQHPIYNLKSAEILTTTQSWKLVQEMHLVLNPSYGNLQNIILLCYRIPCINLNLVYNDVKYKNTEKCWNLLPRTIQNFALNSNVFVNDIEISNWSNAIEKMKYLKCLVFNFSNKIGNHITDEGVDCFSSSLATLKNLTSLTIDFSGGQNSVTDYGIDCLSCALTGLHSLSVFSIKCSMGENQVMDVGFKYLVNAMHGLKKLHEININLEGGKNCITDVSFKNFADEMFEGENDLTKITMDFSWGRSTVTDKGLFIFAKGLLKNKKINYLWLGLKQNEEYITEAGINSIEELNKTRTPFIKMHIFSQGQQL